VAHESLTARPRSGIHAAANAADADAAHESLTARQWQWQGPYKPFRFDRLDFPDAYLVASAERSGVGTIASFDRSIDRVTTVRRVEPA